MFFKCFLKAFLFQPFDAKYIFFKLCFFSLTDYKQTNKLCVFFQNHLSSQFHFLKINLFFFFSQFYNFFLFAFLTLGKWKIEGESRMSYNSNSLTLQLDGNLPNGITICSTFNSIIVGTKLVHWKRKKTICIFFT